MSPSKSTSRHPLTWVPTLYFAEGLPWAVVCVMSAIMYKQLGVSNEDITFWTGLMGFAWVFKPLWSPFLELAAGPKRIVVATQVLGGAMLLLAGVLLHTPGFFIFTVAILSLLAFTSATHDIAADGTYIASLPADKQSLYSGWLGAFWNGGKLFVQGGLVVMAGYLEKHMGASAAQAWSLALLLPGALMVALGLYHAWSMPSIERQSGAGQSAGDVARTLMEVLVDFFSKPGIWVAIAFILLFRVGEGQVQSMGRLFLLETRALGGLGLSAEQMGVAYGTFATLAFIGGSILGGTFAAKMGLQRALFWLILAMNAPNLSFWYLSAYQPTDLSLITAMLSFEMFGYGFGFVGLTLFMMQVVAPGRFPTAHYALATGVMALGFQLSTMVSGKIHAALGYHDFFIWGLLAAIPVLGMSLVVKVRPLSGEAAAAGDAAPSEAHAQGTAD